MSWIPDWEVKRVSRKKESIVSEGTVPEPAIPDLVCFSHLRWDFVFQRPQHLLTRFARQRRVFYIEEPLYDDSGEARLEIRPGPDNLAVTVPRIPKGIPEARADVMIRELIDGMLQRWNIGEFFAWYYTPMSLRFSDHIKPSLTVYDCMDELSAFAGAPSSLVEMEKRLLARADLVFTGGNSLFESKRSRHPSVHAFPSSIDKAHFNRARAPISDPRDQAGIGHPRIGFHGVLDERMDYGLLAEMADLKPLWQWILIGPVCKVDPESLPKRPNLHYLGKKDYSALPDYLAGWDVAMMPFARNASTEFISPTKTPEYLAAGKPVVSTSIRDVVNPYGNMGLVLIADNAPGFVRSCEMAVSLAQTPAWREKVDRHLASTSWDKTWSMMEELMVSAKSGRNAGGRNGNA